MLGLHQFSSVNAGWDQERISRRALVLVRSADTPAATRITAVQICAERGVKEALPTIETLAREPGNLPLQLSAIAALGQLGGAEQAAWLRALKTAGNGDLQPAIRAALKRLAQKQKPFELNRNPT